MANNRAPPPNAVTPAKAGVQLWAQTTWIPAFAGMPRGWGYAIGAGQSTTTQCRHPGESRGPALGAIKMDSGLRRNDGRLGLWPMANDRAPPPTAVTSAKAGVQLWAQVSWIPAFAGMTGGWGCGQWRTTEHHHQMPSCQLWAQTSWILAFAGMTGGWGYAIGAGQSTTTHCRHPGEGRGPALGMREHHHPLPSPRRKPGSSFGHRQAGFRLSPE